MSTAVFPEGMESYNNTQFQPFTSSYHTWKADGRYSFPVGITSGNIPPLTNKDPRNNAYYVGTQNRKIYPSGRSGARPLKWQFRKGTSTRPASQENPNPVQSSQRTSSMISQLIDRPGGFQVKHNPTNEIDETIQLNKDCGTCHGVGLVVSFKPQTFLTNNPEKSVTNSKLCCNMERKARRLVLPANTNLPKKYYTSTKQYLQNRCKTYEQRAFNFQSASKGGGYKPGSPQAIDNVYVANCYPNTTAFPYSNQELVLRVTQIMQNDGLLSSQNIADITNLPNPTLSSLNQYLVTNNLTSAQQVVKNFVNNPYLGMPPSGPSNPAGCKLVVYKPSNYQFATQGGVESSTRTLKLTVDTINTSITSMRRLKTKSLQSFVKVASCNPSIKYVPQYTFIRG